MNPTLKSSAPKPRFGNTDTFTVWLSLVHTWSFWDFRYYEGAFQEKHDALADGGEAFNKSAMLRVSLINRGERACIYYC